MGSVYPSILEGSSSIHGAREGKIRHDQPRVHGQTGRAAPCRILVDRTEPPPPPPPLPPPSPHPLYILTNPIALLLPTRLATGLTAQTTGTGSTTDSITAPAGAVVPRAS